MEKKLVLLSIVFGAIIFGISGFTPNAHAIDYPISGEESCESLPASTTWTLGRCTLDDQLILGSEDVLINNFGITFEVSPTGDFQTNGVITNIGTIEIVGIATLFDETLLENFGTINILTGSTFVNNGEISGSGTITNNGNFLVDGNVDNDLIENFGSLIIGESGAVSSSGTINHNVGATFTNLGEISGTSLNIHEVMDNSGTIAVNDGITTVSSSGVINNNLVIVVDELGTIENLGVINTAEDASIEHNGVINNRISATLENRGSIYFEPKGVLNNFGLLSNVFIGEFEDENGYIELAIDDDDFNQFSIVNTETGTFDNFDTIVNSCGKINGSLSPTSIEPIDDCELIVAILAPIDEASFTDVTPVTFLGLAIDKDAFGTIEEFSANLVWTNTDEGQIGTGATFQHTFTVLGSHTIVATESDSGDSSQVTIKIGILDEDADGAAPPTDDCDDNDPARFVGNPEIPDGIDNDCDGVIPFTETDDDGDGQAEYQGDCDDEDITRFTGNLEVNDGKDNNCDGVIPFTETDDDGDGQAEYQGDCDDSDPLRFALNPEVPDGVDNNCDGVIPLSEFDHDFDGYIEFVIGDLNPPFHSDPNVVGGNDCDDVNPNVNPSKEEDPNTPFDDNCDGILGEDEDEDLDLDGYTFAEGDCNDGEFFMNPGRTEEIDGLDNDCSGTLLDDEEDIDGDQYIVGTFDPLVDLWRTSTVPLGGEDCADDNALRFPNNPEVNDGINNDCDEIIPDNELDLDTDFFTEAPFDPLTDFHINVDLQGGEDCDDLNSNVFPGASEIIDGLVNDCDSSEPLDEQEVDSDGDGHIPGTFDSSIWKGSSDVTGGNDCNDDDLDVYPGNEEVEDGKDNNCDGVQLETETDDDGDGFAEYQGDCNDGNSNIYPNANELDNGVDDNCNNQIDEGLDMDGDGFTPEFQGDCNDEDPNIFPGAQELPNGIDDNCDGFTDNLLEKFTTPEFQENLDNKTIKEYEKMAEDLQEEIEDLEYDNRKLDKKADKYEEKAESALEGDTRKAAYYQAKSDRYEDKANEALEDGKERKAAKYQKTSDYFQAKADKALEGDEEKAAKYQAKADALRAEIASNESLIEMYNKQILVIDMSIGKIPVDYTQTVIVTYENLTDEATSDILDDIKDNLEDIEKLEEKAAKEQEKIDKELAKGNEEKAAEHYQHKLQALEEIEIIEDLNLVLMCAIDFTPEMLLKEVEFSIKIDRDSDDAEEGNDSDNPLDMKLKSSDLDLVEESEYVGLRFNDIPLEQGQIIKNAYIQFTSEDKDDGGAVVTIYGQDIDDAPTFTNSDGDISSRTLTSASVTWNIPDWDDNKSKSEQQTSDITSILEEIIKRPNWSEDNSMVFIISDGQGSDRDAYTYDEKSSKAAKLYITILTDEHKPHHGHEHDDDDDKKGKGHDKHNDKYHDDDD